MKYSLSISNFLEVNSTLCHSIVFLYFLSLITEEGFLISPSYSLEICIQMGISFLFSLPLASLLFTAIYKASSDSHYAFLHFFFLGDPLQGIFPIQGLNSGLLHFRQTLYHLIYQGRLLDALLAVYMCN